MISDVKITTEQKMHKSLEALKTDLGKVRTGRAHTGILDHLTVDYSGTQKPIKQVPNLTLLDASTIGILLWTNKMGAVFENLIGFSEQRINRSAQGDLI